MTFARLRLKLAHMPFSTLIDAADLRSLLARPGLAVIDCRFDLLKPGAGRRAYLAGHIPGAQYADLELDLSAPVGPDTGRHPLPSRREFAARLGAWGVGNDSHLIAYDDAGGAYAARLWWMARWLGHRQVAVLDGGIQAWRSAGGALQAGEVTAESRIFEPGSGPDFITSAEVVAALADPGRLLVDARSPERYAGAVEPLDAVAGHVPGAVNQPFMVNLDAAGRFKPPAELKRLWQERLGGRPAAAVIAMCGSGVTACQNLLALESAGLGGAGLYAGSWSEWIRDPKRPVARGGAPA